MNIQELTKGIYGCSCGRDHLCPIDVVDISETALDSLPEYVNAYDRILIVADRNTSKACGDRVFSLLEKKVTSYVVLENNGDGLVVPNEEKIAEIESYFDGNDLILGVGSGVINDLCKYVSFEKDVPYFIVATAPSMDGYASAGAAMILQGMKITTGARPPKGILADPTVLKDAPFEMIKAGYGDIVGKFSCLNDWKLSHVINGEYLCETVWQLMYDTAVAVKDLAAGIMAKDEASVQKLMEALVVAGIAMAYVGNSRPASGSEHHLSHFFEITGILDRKPYFCHGIDVVYASVVTAEIREKILKAKPSYQPFRKTRFETEIRRIYKSSADGVIALQEKLGWHEQNHETVVKERWDRITEVLKEAPSRREMLDMLEAVGLNYAEFEALYGDRKIQDAKRYAKELKDRYSVLWLADQYVPEAIDLDPGKIKVVAMDLDGTLCQHKSHLPEENKEALRALKERYTLLMSGAGMCERIFHQMEEFPVNVLGTYGMQYCEYDPETGTLKKVFDEVAPCDKESVRQRIDALRERFGFTEYRGESVEYHASGCVTFPILGMKAIQEEKLAFDPDRKKRRAILAEVKAAFPEYNVFVGGSSSFDMAPKPYDKAYALKKYAEAHGLQPEEIVYIGDDYGEGGNDESVFLSEFHYLPIDDYREFPETVKCLLR